MISRIAQVVAWLMLVGSVLQLALGVAIATGVIGPYEWALARYTMEDSSGEVIDKGWRNILIALALGTLAEIGLALGKRAASSGTQ